jgi:hypothetical protein
MGISAATFIRKTQEMYEACPEAFACAQMSDTRQAVSGSSECGGYTNLSKRKAAILNTEGRKGVCTRICEITKITEIHVK